MLRNSTFVRRTVPALVTGAVLVAVAGGGSPAGASEQPPGPGDYVSTPYFQMPFTCGTKWQLNTWAHSPALDVVVKGNTGSAGKAVLSSATGTVAATYKDRGSGNTIQINHGNGWFTAYYHLKDDPTKYVRKGQRIARGKQIGRIGTSGKAGGWAHLHYEQRYKRGATLTHERDRKPVKFDGKTYTGADKQWKSVTSRNC
ncbi:M23 family metallopeptidase [Streptomyces sp. NBC_00094]|uniref:M23 family metallopeptidase n=1 Tax=Streptomyces sp. NBC_00094 TaxID=2903620 RepID=UPI0022563CD6|nr:M23 family metallopeptidase [Streptomyces sp. NBC_00094]MCX5392685.1 M23 family metallopeptidase [Streptomyces sp. NBC_00094]